ARHPHAQAQAEGIGMLSHLCRCPGVLQHSLLSGDIAKAIYRSDAGVAHRLRITHASRRLSASAFTILKLLNRYASPREVTKRRRPYDGGPLRGLHTPPAPKSGSVRTSLRSNSGRFFIRFRHWRRVAI